MAIAITLDPGQDGRYVQGSKLVRKGTLNLGTSYATGGVAIAKGDLDLPVSLDHLDVGSPGGYVFEWDKTNGKIKAYLRAAITENVAATYTQNASLAAVTLAEVAAATNLSAVSARFLAYGN